MARNLAILLATSIICALVAAQVNAETGLFGAGARFSWNNYTNSYLIHNPEYSEVGLAVV
jgi:hypothetical protein